MSYTYTILVTILYFTTYIHIVTVIYIVIVIVICHSHAIGIVWHLVMILILTRLRMYFDWPTGPIDSQIYQMTMPCHFMHYYAMQWQRHWPIMSVMLIYDYQIMRLLCNDD